MNAKNEDAISERSPSWHGRAESLLESEQLYWLSLSMNERLAALDGIFQDYQRMGGSLDPDPDPQSPFWSREELKQFACSRGTLLQNNR